MSKLSNSETENVMSVISNKTGSVAITDVKLAFDTPFLMCINTNRNGWLH